MFVGIENLQEIISHYAFIMLRLSSMFVAAPVFGSNLIPVKIRIITALLVTILVGSYVNVPENIDVFSINGGLIAIQQIAIGIIIGLVFQFIFQIVVLGGQVIALQGGLGFATLVDPQSRETLPMVSQFYLMTITLLFLAFNGHLVLLEMLISSFDTLPVGQNGINADNIWKVAEFGGTIFSGAVAIALPAIIALLMVNVTFAVMTKSAPQLNIFTIGFPLTLMLGLLVMYLSYPILAGHAEYLFSTGFILVKQILS